MCGLNLSSQLFEASVDALEVACERCELSFKFFLSGCAIIEPELYEFGGVPGGWALGVHVYQATNIRTITKVVL
ncbi:hypothetical protein HMPREF2807_09030 [Corynebacterium sp. HMSC074A09]|nr:hypothetical protein HMPREF2807_09030 [Corynebacterium sp. HMSC074A09]OFP26478.1 hypothetical protein HMPREF2993_03475 [Corynebacterium sp. HMSC068G04]